jgi:hypothetical protein
MMKGLAAVVLVSGLVSVAHAERPRATYRWTDPSRMGATVEIPPNVSHTIFLNNCQPNGCTLHAGFDNATTDTSSIPNGTSLVQPYSGSATQWNSLVNCVKQAYAPFNVQIVTTRPASPAQYHMAIVAGSPQNVGEQNGVLGVSPFSCGYISNSVSFTFANVEPTNILDLCWTVSQETAHSWGLDHKFDNRDPMTYLETGPTMKTFQNEAGACGEYNARSCSCNYANTGTQKMNSYALIMATFGSSAPDTVPPTVAITAPANGAQVQPGFPVRANISDDVLVAKAELRIDGTLVGTLTGAPWVWNAPQTLSMGGHHVEVTAYDTKNNTKAAVDVSYGTVCTGNDMCGDKEVCLGGHCVAGPDMQGGLGSPCTGNEQCLSGSCASDGTDMVCVEPCDVANDQCPANFSCIEAGPGGVCWPGGDSGGGGGCNTGGSGAPVGLLGLLGALGLVSLGRRKRI